MTRRPRGIVVFDLDGTLLRGNTVCEVLARPLGRLERMSEFEKLESESEIADARQEMLSWYRERTRAELCAYLADATWAPGAKRAVRDLQRADMLVGIASITWRFAVEWFANQLDVRHYLGTDEQPDGAIAHVWGRDKARWLANLAGSYRIPRNRIAAVGDSTGDVDMLNAAHLRYFVGEARGPEIPALVCMPNADLMLVAESIIDAWAHPTSTAPGAGP